MVQSVIQYSVSTLLQYCIIHDKRDEDRTLSQVLVPLWPSMLPFVATTLNSGPSLEGAMHASILACRSKHSLALPVLPTSCFAMYVIEISWWVFLVYAGDSPTPPEFDCSLGGGGLAGAVVKD